MATMMCPDKLNCDGSDWPITNYTSEGAEPFPPWYSVQFPPDNPPPIDTEYVREGCLFVCRSYVSQEDADLCAQRQAVLCTTPPGSVWYSAPASCSVTCPDGTVFYYTVPAGTFIASSYDEAYRQAQQYACDRAAEERICLSSIPRCACYGVFYSAEISTDSTRSDLVWSVVGTLPIGLNLLSNGATAIIAGTPTVNGTYSFTIVATTPAGNYSARIYTIQVLQITTTSLPEFVVGTPYSYQLAAAGGSGNYSWRTAIGTLPDGLTLSSTGLISGTPTGLTTGGALTFEVIDTVCELTNRTFYTPTASLVTSATTIIRSKKGFPEYRVNDGTLYKKVTYSGDITQTAITLSGIQCAGAKYVYSGADQIDANGNFISAHRKDLLVECPMTVYPQIAEGEHALFELTFPGYYTEESRIHRLLGFCWPGQIGSCNVCNPDDSTWVSYGDYAVRSPTDLPYEMLLDTNAVTKTDTVYWYSGEVTYSLFYIVQVVGIPLNIVYPTSLGSFSATLSEPYTDADAIASQQSYTSVLAVAENKPNYMTGSGNGGLRIVYSRFTTVNFYINCANLVPGSNYRITYDLLSSDGTTTTETHDFTATLSTYTLTGVVPTPASGKTTKIKNPKIAYA